MSSSPLVFTAVEASNATVDYVDYQRSNDGQGMPLYINGLDYDPETEKGFLPVLPGELITVLGRPGNGKSSFMMRWARMRAGHLKILGVENKIVVYMTAEQLVEELRLFHVAAELRISITEMASGKLGDGDWKRVREHLAGPHMMTTPLWFIGKSRERRKTKTEITEETLRAAMSDIEQWQGNQVVQEIDSIFIDYVQRFRPRSSAWVEFYGDLMNGLKNLAEDFNTRMVAGCQAKREVDQRQVPIPMMDDGQWTSTVEQFSDGVLSVVRPSHYVVPDAKLPAPFGKKDSPLMYVKDHHDMIISALKRKKGPANFKKFVKFEPEYNYLVQGELKYYDPERDVDKPEGSNA